MEKYFANYNQSLALKEIGFDIPCFRYVYIGDTGNNVNRYEEVEPSRAINYNHDSLCISQPLKSQVFEWFREKCNIQGYMYPLTIEGYKNGRIFTNYVYTIKPLYGDIIESEVFETYEESESACIDKLIEIVKNK